jgi:serine/threonine protein kinase
VHAKKLIHRDVKAANFLVGDNWHVKLCDFGFSRSISSPPTKGAKQAAGNQMTLCVPEDHELLTNEGLHGPRHVPGAPRRGRPARRQLQRVGRSDRV